MTPSSSKPSAPGSACLVLLCKRPAAGHSKQRLAEQIGQPAALRISAGLLDCALEDLRQWPARRVIAPDHPQHHEWARSLCPQACVLAQAEGNLGQRLNDLDSRLRAEGLQSLIFIGSDCPALREEDYRNVADRLQTTDTVLINARDGGVVLMASNLPWPDLSRLPWSTAQLGQALAACCREAGHSLSIAGELFDIDHQEDLALLQSLADDGRPARQALWQLLHDPEMAAYV